MTPGAAVDGAIYIYKRRREDEHVAEEIKNRLQSYEFGNRDMAVFFVCRKHNQGGGLGFVLTL